MARPSVRSRAGVSAGTVPAALARALFVGALAAAIAAAAAAAPPPQLANLWREEQAVYDVNADDLSDDEHAAPLAADDGLASLVDYSAFDALSAAKADSRLHAMDDRAQRVRLALELLERVAEWYGSRAPTDGDKEPRVGDSNEGESYIDDGAGGDGGATYSDERYEDGRAKKNFAKLSNTRLAINPIGADY